MAKKIKIFLNNELFCDDATVAGGFFERLSGLMFQFKPQTPRVLVFKNAFWIHSFFVFFRFDAVFLDREYKVIAYKNNIPPFLILKPVFGAKCTIELVNNYREIKIGDKMLINEY